MGVYVGIDLLFMMNLKELVDGWSGWMRLSEVISREVRSSLFEEESERFSHYLVKIGFYDGGMDWR